MSILTHTSQNDALLESKLNYLVSIVEYEEAIRKIKNLETLQQQSHHKIASLEDEVARLKEQLRLMQHQRFGKKIEVNIGQPTTNPKDNRLQMVSGYTRKKGTKSCGRTLDTSTLPRHQFYHDLSEEDKICQGCHNPLKKIGQDVSEQLEVLPLRLYVAEHVRYK